MNIDYQHQFLTLFKAAGRRGIPNWQLSNIALQYNFVIYQLRKEGRDIRKYRKDPGSKTFYYYLIQPESEVPHATSNPVHQGRGSGDVEQHFEQISLDPRTFDTPEAPAKRITTTPESI